MENEEKQPAKKPVKKTSKTSNEGQMANVVVQKNVTISLSKTSSKIANVDEAINEQSKSVKNTDEKTAPKKKRVVIKKQILTATNPKRFLAYIVDWYLATVLGNLPILFTYSSITGNTDMPDMTKIPANMAIMAYSIALIVVLAYFILIPLYAFKGERRGQTLGKRLVGLKIVKENGDPVGLKNLILREIVGILLIEGALCVTTQYFKEIIAIITGVDLQIMLYWTYASMAITFVSIVYAAIKPHRRMIHDYIGKTMVVMFNQDQQ